MGRGHSTATEILYGNTGERTRREAQLKREEQETFSDGRFISSKHQTAEGAVEFFDQYDQLCKVEILPDGKYTVKNLIAVKGTKQRLAFKEPAIFYIRDDTLHRDPAEGPALITPDGSYSYYVEGVQHRDPAEGPAAAAPDGSKYYYRQGLLHREGAPAVVLTNGGRDWYQDGQLHRTDGPAMDSGNGYQEWWQHGQRHREDGPAIVSTSAGREKYYWKGKGCTDQDDYERRRRASLGEGTPAKPNKRKWSKLIRGESHG